MTLLAIALAPATRAVDPPPDGGYPGRNTAEGDNALESLARGGVENTALGYVALLFNTTGDRNTATGAFALSDNTTGSDNTASGVQALLRNTTGFKNTANGVHALYYNTTGSQNTADGYQALLSNTTGFSNTAHGQGALISNTTGESNTAEGARALFFNTTGRSNIALGVAAGANLTTGDGNIDIGHPGFAGEAYTIRIGTPGVQGTAFIAGIRDKTVANGISVVINPNGKLGTTVSSARFKDEIRPMADASEALLALQPVTFRYKEELDSERIPQFGLIAEEVEKVNPDLVARGADGKVSTVRYEAVNAMLLNEFLKQHQKVEEQACEMQEEKTTIDDLKGTVATQ
ncbi:MAG: tail fiber domain-containing protein, partial [Chthoniobacterales bacterium]